MSIFTKRNAAVGWLALKVGKKVAKKKAKSVPAKRSKPALIAGAAAGVSGVALLLRKLKGGKGDSGGHGQDDQGAD
jgi:hypothetical protein